MDPLDWLAEQAVAWVTSLRTVHRPHSQILPPAQRGRLEPFFDVMTLDRARFRVVPIIENPPFLTQAQELGIPPAIDFTQMSGLTLDDTVLLSEHRPVDNFLALLFHDPRGERVLAAVCSWLCRRRVRLQCYSSRATSLRAPETV